MAVCNSVLYRKVERSGVKRVVVTTSWGKRRGHIEEG